VDTETLLEIFMKTTLKKASTTFFSGLVIGLSLQGFFSTAIAGTKTEPTRSRVPYTNSNRPPGHKKCDCPYDRNKNNIICGGSSAYAKQGGDETLCYVGETASREKWWYSEDTKKVDPRTGV
jgi:hypothetical protein